MDLALIVIDDAPEDVQPLRISSEIAGLNSDVRIVGHHNAPWSISRGYVSKEPQNNNIQLAETAIGKGSSGSPILNRENEVVGIVFSIEPPNIGNGSDFLGGFSYGYSANILVDTLRKWNIL